MLDHLASAAAQTLTPLFTVHYRANVSNDLIENELVHVFGGRFEGEPNPNPAEVEDWRWASPEAIRQDVTAHPDHYSVWFRKYLDEFGGEIGGIAAVPDDPLSYLYRVADNLVIDRRRSAQRRAGWSPTCPTTSRPACCSAGWRLRQPSNR